MGSRYWGRRRHAATDEHVQPEPRGAVARPPAKAALMCHPGAEATRRRETGRRMWARPCTAQCIPVTSRRHSCSIAQSTPLELPWPSPMGGASSGRGPSHFVLVELCSRRNLRVARYSRACSSACFCVASFVPQRSHRETRRLPCSLAPSIATCALTGALAPCPAHTLPRSEAPAARDASLALPDARSLYAASPGCAKALTNIPPVDAPP